jgi:hypothetical protein
MATSIFSGVSCLLAAMFEVTLFRHEILYRWLMLFMCSTKTHWFRSRGGKETYACFGIFVAAFCFSILIYYV